MKQHTPATARTDRVAVVVNTRARGGARALPLVAQALRGVADEVSVHPYRSHRPFAARLELDDGSVLELTDLMQVAVGNGRNYGGGLTVAPNASIDDHLLDVYAVEQGRLRDHLSVARLLCTGHLVEHERVHHVTARRLRLVTDEPLPVNLDGEIAATTPATFEVDRNALHVIVPAHSRAARMDGAPTP